jgi:hypothetical protein
MPTSLWAVAGGVWLACSAIVAGLVFWDRVRDEPSLPLTYELVMVACGPITLIAALVLGREPKD